jgi:hypothetical protein
VRQELVVLRELINVVGNLTGVRIIASVFRPGKVRKCESLFGVVCLGMLGDGNGLLVCGIPPQATDMRALVEANGVEALFTEIFQRRDASQSCDVLEAIYWGKRTPYRDRQPLLVRPSLSSASGASEASVTVNRTALGTVAVSLETSVLNACAHTKGKMAYCGF